MITVIVNGSAGLREIQCTYFSVNNNSDLVFYDDTIAPVKGCPFLTLSKETWIGAEIKPEEGKTKYVVEESNLEEIFADIDKIRVHLNHLSTKTNSFKRL